MPALSMKAIKVGNSVEPTSQGHGKKATKTLAVATDLSAMAKMSKALLAHSGKQELAHISAPCRLI